eukprot:7348747-Pyramimonas_sp.AAC.1
MRPAHPFWHTLHAFRCPIGSSTEGPRGAIRTRLPHPVQLRRRPSEIRASLAPTLHTFRGPIGSSTGGLSGCARMRPAHPCRPTPHTL